MRNTPFSDAFRLLVRRQTQGPALILTGCMLLYMLSTRVQNAQPTLIVYIMAGLLIVVALAGIVLTFRELSSQQPVAQLDAAPRSSSDLEHAVTQLSKNYELLRRQSAQGFILGAVCMLLGVVVILSGSVGQLFGFAKGGSDLATVAGIITEFISGTALVMYRLNFKRLGETSTALHETWRVLTAFRLAETLPGQEKTRATLGLIQALIGNVHGHLEIPGDSPRIPGAS